MLIRLSVSFRVNNQVQCRECRRGRALREREVFSSVRTLHGVETTDTLFAVCLSCADLTHSALNASAALIKRAEPAGDTRRFSISVLVRTFLDLCPRDS